MQSAETHYKKLVLVCTNERPNGENCCAGRGGVELHQKIKEAVKAEFTGVRVSKSGCLGNCATGVSVVIMPDDLWLGGVTEADIPEILSLIRATL